MDALSPLATNHFFKTGKPLNSTTQGKHGHSFRMSRVASGKFANAPQQFDENPPSDTFSWNSIIRDHLAKGDPLRVLSTYHRMLLRGVHPDKHTLPRILAASRLSLALFFGKQVHAQVLKLGFSAERYVITALIEMYGSLDCAEAAKWLLYKSRPANSVSWTLLAKLYLLEGKPALAVDVFNQMVVELGDEIDPVALATAIGACGMMKSLQEGRKVHQIAKNCGLELEALVGNSLLKMYADCRSIEDARAVFDGMPSKNAISWTTMVGAYVKGGGFNKGLKLCRQMIAQGIKPDSLTISSILPACARVAAHKNGKEIHGYVLRNGISLNVAVQNALMDMYVKSGFVEWAETIFARMKDKDAISWTVMMLGHSLHGRGELGADLFREMDKNGSIEIDEITYAAALHACSTARMVEEGKFYFSRIKAPQAAHYVLMVALLARAGLLQEAKAFIESRGMEGHPEIWRALLDGCRIHQNAWAGKRVIEHLCELEPLNAENYVLLSNWYAENGKWDMVEELRETIADMGLKPRKAYSWIELGSKVHVFGTGSVAHPRSERIYWELRSLMEKVEEDHSDFGLHDVHEERECVAIGHSEMLALSFGLISTEAGATIRLTKNLRVCRNCHYYAKHISKKVQREIIIKDPNLFHHFRDGSCSCGDCW